MKTERERERKWERDMFMCGGQPLYWSVRANSWSLGSLRDRPTPPLVASFHSQLPNAWSRVLWRFNYDPVVSAARLKSQLTQSDTTSLSRSTPKIYRRDKSFVVSLASPTAISRNIYLINYSFRMVALIFPRFSLQSSLQ